MIFAKRVFLFAGVYGLLVILPQYFLEAQIGRDYPPPITHPEHSTGSSASRWRGRRRSW